jgi:2'-5' RNA ligase
MSEPPEPQRMINHWWWRPGWRVGRQFYTWHLTFADVPDVHRLAHAYGPYLDLPGLDLIPDPGLHLTMQGIGFVDEVAPADVVKIAQAARTQLAHIEPFTISLGPTVVDDEVVRLEVAPIAPVRELRDRLRVAIAEVWGPDNVPEAADGFTPHVSLAYSNRDGDITPIQAATSAVSPEPAIVAVSHADLILLNRDQQQYQWTTHARVPLGG